MCAGFTMSGRSVYLVLSGVAQCGPFSMPGAMRGEGLLCLVVVRVRVVVRRLIRMRFGVIGLVMRVGRLCRRRVSGVMFPSGLFLTLIVLRSNIGTSCGVSRRR